MSDTKANITIPVDLTNPGQFFACCGLLELADRLWPGAEGWFDGDRFCVATARHTLKELLEAIGSLDVANTMSDGERDRLREFSIIRKGRKLTDEEEAEEAILDGMRRKAPIVLSGRCSLRIDWFCDPFTRGFSLKTWAGQQSVLTYAKEMHSGLVRLLPMVDGTPWLSLRDIGLPFNFDSDIGAQGTGRDIGFVFDAFKSSRIARFNRGCRPILEFLCFVGLQRFRPLELPGGETFRYATWGTSLLPNIAAAVASTCVDVQGSQQFEFIMFNRNKDYYCFFPAHPYQGDRNE